MNVKRGDVFEANLGKTIGSEQGGIRPVIVIQNNIGNAHSSTIIIAPFTSKKKSALPTHKKVQTMFLEEVSTMLFEQIRCIDKQRLIKYLGHYNGDIDEEIKISLGLEE